MVIAGAGGHAIEVLGILDQNRYAGTIRFFDDTAGSGGRVFGVHEVLTSAEEAAAVFAEDRSFVIGVGRPSARRLLFDKLTDAGGIVRSVISPYAHIGSRDVLLGEGLNIMTGAVLTVATKIGLGTLIHVHCSIHHDTVIGEFCELSPGCRILGKVRIGSFVSVGTGAVILPGISIGDKAVIGAGAVVTADVPPGMKVAGVPAKEIQ